MNDCLFCKIVAGKIPANKVYEDENVLAFLDIAPNNPGHTLAIPKKHYETYLDTPDETLGDLSVKIKKIATGVKKATGAEGMNIFVNAHKAAGQIVPHLHVHIIPRYFSDNFKHWASKKYAEDEAEKIAEKIKEEIK